MLIFKKCLLNILIYPISLFFENALTYHQSELENIIEKLDLL